MIYSAHVFSSSWLASLVSSVKSFPATESMQFSAVQQPLCPMHWRYCILATVLVQAYPINRAPHSKYLHHLRKLQQRIVECIPRTLNTVKKIIFLHFVLLLSQRPLFFVCCWENRLNSSWQCLMCVHNFGWPLLQTALILAVVWCVKCIALGRKLCVCRGTRVISQCPSIGGVATLIHCIASTGHCNALQSEWTPHTC